MKKIISDKTKLTREEDLIEQQLQSGDYVSDNGAENRKMWREAIAQYHELSRTKRMTMRVDVVDLIKVKAKARENSMPYQTLLKILFKQFAEGKVSIRV